MRPILLLSAAGMLWGCGQDSSFTKLLEPEPSAEDTGMPPVEADEAVLPEPSATCPDRIFAARVTTTDEDCQNEPPVVRYTPVVEWQMSTFDDYPERIGHWTVPVVGQLTDDNGDGVITADDVPDIVTISSDPDLYSPSEETLRLISGDGTAVHWSRTHWAVGDEILRPIFGGTPALGDLDADGRAEIVLVVGPERESDGRAQYTYRHSGVYDCFVAVLDTAGELSGLQLDTPVPCLAHSPSLADVQSDGEIDIVVGNQTFRSSDLQEIGAPYDYGASTPGMGREERYWTGGIPVSADLDGDGALELVTSSHIQEWDGAYRCNTGLEDGRAAVADIDGDGRGEVVAVPGVIAGSDSSVVIFNDQCQIETAWPLDDGGRGGPPTIADFDGDGVPEVGLASEQMYMVYEVDGTLKWTSPATDESSNCTGSAVFDFEADGYAEVVYADETDLWIISGHSGDFVMRWAGHSSWTANEYPSIVDVDGDGAAEIVVSGKNGIAVIGAEEGWAPARQVWNQHAYWITNVGDDLTIPSPTPQNWPEYNSFRSGDLRVNAGQGARLVDAKPFVHDICEVECGEGTVEVALSPNNEGLADAIDGVNLAVYAEQTDGSRVLLEVLSAEDLHRAGYATEGVVLELAMTDLPTGALILVADDDGTGTGVIEECNEGNNELRLEGLCADD